MNIDELTITEAKQRLAEAQEIAEVLDTPHLPKPKTNLSTYGVGRECIIRTYSAGVFFGTPKERSGQEVILTNVRRIWSWEGAFTLSAVAQHGVTGAKLSCAEPEKLVLEVIEISPCSDKAANQLREMTAHA